jgi:hypothetical protein
MSAFHPKSCSLVSQFGNSGQLILDQVLGFMTFLTTESDPLGTFRNSKADRSGARQSFDVVLAARRDDLDEGTAFAPR